MQHKASQSKLRDDPNTLKYAQQKYIDAILSQEMNNKNKIKLFSSKNCSGSLENVEMKVAVNSQKLQQHRQSNSLLFSERQEFLYPLQFQKLMKLDQLRRYKFKQEMGELRDPETDYYSQGVIPSRQTEKDIQNLYTECENWQQDQQSELKEQDFELHLEQIPVFQQSPSPQNKRYSCSSKKREMQQVDQQKQNISAENNVFSRLLAFQNKYLQKKTNMERKLQQKELKECTFKPEITKKAQLLNRSDGDIQE